MARALSPMRWRAAPSPCWRGPNWRDEAAALGVRFIADENPRAGLARYGRRIFRRPAGHRWPPSPAPRANPPSSLSCAKSGRRWASRPPAWARSAWSGPKGDMPLSHTTPDPVEIHALLAQLKKDGVEHLAIEASSHGLDQYRLDGVKIAAAGFTNITRDHMDYHATFERLPGRQAAAVQRSGGAGWRRGRQCRCGTCRRIHRGGASARACS